jgi:hypothetical protein
MEYTGLQKMAIYHSRLAEQYRRYGIILSAGREHNAHMPYRAWASDYHSLRYPHPNVHLFQGSIITLK